MTETNLPDAGFLVEVARTAADAVPSAGDAGKTREARRRAANKALDRWKPAIDELTDVTGSARFLGLKGPDSIRARMRRTRVDDTPEWPAPDQRLGNSPLWRYRTLVIQRIEQPGKGRPGKTRGPNSRTLRRQEGTEAGTGT